MHANSLIVAGFMALVALPVAAQTAKDSTAPAGTYHLDPLESHLLFRVSHLGFSTSMAIFKRFDATLQFDPAKPDAMMLDATVDATSVETNYQDPKQDFNAIIAGADLLDAKDYPAMTFHSTKIALTGSYSADVTGDLTLHGVTRPVTINVTFNGGYAPNEMDPSGARVGFSATGSLKRSDFGIVMGLPDPGKTFGIGDKVDFIIETELLNPDAAKK